MRLSEIRDILHGKVYTGEALLDNVDIRFGCASDLMSDVLAFSRAGAVLLTGLVNTQTIQTAFIAEISGVVFVRGKRPGEDILALARERQIPVLSTPYSMYEASGKLYTRGLISTMEPAINAGKDDSM
jgi:predicted transcriptional regulator